MMEQVAKAHIKLYRVSPRKARLVADLCRFKKIEEAINILKNTHKKSSIMFIKLINSAVANAVNNHGLDATKLIVSQLIVNEGATLKRHQPHARGRAFSIKKRTSKISITVKEQK
ncbi:MAG: 50S ribosomal protein L22 [Mycoplasma sp.]|nr:50S ribosomal protein L22 [Mycoplasma sp.]